MSRKKRILVCGEASFLSTGFGTYNLELLKRLHASGKYDIFEASSYGPHNDPRAADLPWPFMTFMPDKDNKREVERYNSNPINQFGEWRFEEACLRHKPDIVIDIRDWWMLEYQERSPYRPYYHWAIMPTVDAEPQDEQWLSTYSNADAVFAYSDWALSLLNKQSNGVIKTVCSAPPGGDLETYQFEKDRRGHRKRVGIDPDCFIVGTVMRNQRRKLYPDLIVAFKRFLEKAPEEIAKKTFLYMHTCWPDLGWDIPRLVKEAGLGHKCVFTYFCKTCGAVFPSFFQDARGACRTCGNTTASFPSSNVGVPRKVLGSVLSLMDVYVQYANSEGFGMPQIEAAACGIPVMATDYSAMSDVVRKLKGYPISVERMFREPETHCWRALPDGNDFADKLIEFFSLPEPVRMKKGWKAREAVEKHYTWDQTAKRWMDHFDSIEVRPNEQTWGSPPKIHRPNLRVPDGLSNEDFVSWGIREVAGRPDLANSYMALRMVRDLNWGQTIPGIGGLYFNEDSTLGTQKKPVDFDRNTVMNLFVQMCENRNQWEMRRVGK